MGVDGSQIIVLDCSLPYDYAILKIANKRKDYYVHWQGDG